ncbi:MAG: rhodanese-like domain-containing protein [Litoreibacter sp.]|nr:rhodanese-like domain-containing protein [Litoreibacter sp.]
MTRSVFTRRRILTAGIVLVAGGAAIAAGGGRNLFYDWLTEETRATAIDPAMAHSQSLAGEITLIDIRRPEEWAQTGSGEGAVRLDMRRKDFIAALDQIVDGDRAQPVALICARGVRSARMSNLLAAAGFTQIIDVPEGMFGSGAGPGWLRRGLPLDRSPVAPADRGT